MMDQIRKFMQGFWLSAVLVLGLWGCGMGHEGIEETGTDAFGRPD